jgi:predicted acylesterase/phospholipase RssA
LIRINNGCHTGQLRVFEMLVLSFTMKHLSRTRGSLCRTWSVTLIVLFLAGCCACRHSPFTGLSLQQSRALAEDLAFERDQELQADLRSAFANRPPRNVLILSGGDANGAFGCGILSGWRNAPAGRPKFDVVTGVSTGAFIAVFAFLGEDQDDTTLREVYTTIRDKDVFEGFAPPNSLFDTAPLMRLIAKYVTAHAIRRVAAAHREGRRLYVTTVELESGCVYIWPLSKIAFDAVHRTTSSASNPAADPSETEHMDRDGIERFRRILLAAAAIPVFFPPVEIDGGLHFDAGLREAISLRQFMLGLHRAAEAVALTSSAAQNLDNKSVPDESSPIVWAILNGKLRSPPKPVGNNLLSVGVRSLEVFNETVVILSLRDAAHVAASHTPPFQFRWLSEPDDLDAGPGPGLFHPMFDPTVTKRLFIAGQSLAEAGVSAWKQGPPPLDADHLDPSEK